MGQRFTGPTAYVMRPSTWAWILAERDSTGRPLVEPGDVAVNPVVVASTRPADYQVRAVGTLFGVPVVLDGNIPNNLGAGTNETRIIAADFRDVILMEDPSGAPSSSASTTCCLPPCRSGCCATATARSRPAASPRRSRSSPGPA